MKRPLFTFCLFVILVLTLLTFFGVFSKDRHQALLPADKSVIHLTGTICKTDSEKIYLNHISFYYPDTYTNSETGTNSDPATDTDSATDPNPASKIAHQSVLSQHQSHFLPSDFTFTFSANECDITPAIGNTVEITAKFKAYSHATNPGEFDAFDYYSSQNIYGTLSKLKLKITSGHINPIKHGLNKLRNAGTNVLNRSYSAVNATIMSDMLFGDKAGLDPNIKELYQKVGISHILSISSLHISIIGLGLFKLLRKLRCPIKISAVVSGTFLVLFGIMTGMSISAIRAIGIYIIGVLAQILGRTTDTLTSLTLVATIILLINPSLLTSCGFLLSFGSVLGICCLYPALKEIITSSFTPLVKYRPDTGLYRFRKRIINLLTLIADSLLAGISLTITTLPIQLYFFYEIPLYSSFLNLAVIPLMSVLMICGYLSVFFPFLYIPSKICSFILNFYTASAQLFEAIPHSYWNPGRPSAILLILYYALWLAVVLYPSKKALINRIFRHKWKFNCITAVIFTALLLAFNHCSLPRNSVIFMDVGQGDCILVYTDSRDVLLFDGGSSSRAKVGQYVIKSTLKYYGLSHISAIYVSHADNDHINGIKELLNNQKKWNLRIDSLFLTNFESSSDFVNYSGYNNFDTRNSIASTEPSIYPSVQTISVGYEKDYGSVHLTCLHPSSEFYAEDTNSASMCILLEFTESSLPSAEGNTSSSVPASLLLCGDVCDDGERLLTDAISPFSPVTMLKVAHHGSKYSTTDQFLSSARPTLAFISAGADNSYGHPHSETLERLSNHGCLCFSTIDSGAVIITVKKASLVLSEYRSMTHP